MKKLLLISAMLLVGALSVSSQTYCYKNTFKVSEDGVRIKETGMIQYYTFTNNKSVCYPSDKDGNANTPTPMPFNYEGSNNGVLTYSWRPKNPYGNLPMPSKTIYFSSDYSRINILEGSMLDGKKYTWVYERINSPKDQESPTQLY